jgi:hypothetical protein
MGKPVSKPVNPPTEVDGWRVLPDPQYDCIYWRCRALVVESGTWVAPVGWYDDWLPLNAAHWAFTNRWGATHTVERKAVWESLFLEP